MILKDQVVDIYKKIGQKLELITIAKIIKESYNM